jgi:hypothetical protein
MDVTAWWIKGIKPVLSLLILTILLALTGGVVKTLLDLKLLLNNPVEVTLRQIIIDTLTSVSPAPAAASKSFAVVKPMSRMPLVRSLPMKWKNAANMPCSFSNCRLHSMR